MCFSVLLDAPNINVTNKLLGIGRSDHVQSGVRVTLRDNEREDDGRALTPDNEASHRAVGLRLISRTLTEEDP